MKVLGDLLTAVILFLCVFHLLAAQILKMTKMQLFIFTSLRLISKSVAQ